jgi:fermentation-respiration switch protein FrsA (DUF1100 family)
MSVFPLARPAGSAVVPRVETFRGADGVDLVMTRRSRGTRQAIVVAPGLFTHRETPEHRALAERLVELADVFTVDVRGHGDSGGSFTWGVRESADLAILADNLRADYDRVAGVGFSFGGYHVGAATARYQAFDAVAMIGTPRSFFILDRHFLLRGIRRSFAALRRRRRTMRRFSLMVMPPGRGRRPDAATIVSAISPAPLLIAHGTRDWLLGTHHAHSLYARAQQPKSLVLVDGGSHAEGMMLAHADQLVDPLLTFLDRWL